MSKTIAAIVQEALAVIGTGLFAFGLWQIYPPATFLFTGAALIAPFALSIRGK